MRPSQMIAAMLALSCGAEALDAFKNIQGLDGVKDVLLGRQDNNNNNNNNNNNDKSSQQPTKTAAPESSKPSQSGSNNNDNKETDSAQASGSRTTTGKPKSTSFDARLPAGGVSMITPNPIAGEQYYKVGDWVTFAWNYTSLSVTPSFIDVMASCTANQATYTIAVNHSAADTTVLWNTKDTPSGQPPFLTEKYTLLIYDAESSVSAAPRPGYLGVFNQLTFGMYTPQPKVAWQDYQCANCVKNGALSPAEQLTLKVMLFTSGTTIASLLYFSHNFGLW